MSVPAWQILAGLPAWQVTQIPRPALPGADTAGGDGSGRAPAAPAERDRGQRMMALASAARSGSAAAFGWVRDTGSGPVKVIAAGKGMSADDGTAPAGSADPVPLGYPAGAIGRPLPPGGLTAAFTALPYWMPVAITPDALLAEIQDGLVTGSTSLEDGLRAWRKPFGWLAIADPVGKDRRDELLSEASLAQLTADRHDSPRAKQSAVRSKARHDELRQAATIGLWDIWLLAGAATPAGAARVAGLVCASLDLRGLPFGLTEQDRCGPLPELLGAPPASEPVPEPGALARDVLGMYDGQEPARGTGMQYAGDPGYGAYPAEGPGPGGSPVPGSTAQRWSAPGERGSGFPAGNGFPTWAPAPAPGQAPGGQRPAWAGGTPTTQRATAGSGLVPDFPDPVPEFPCAASSRLLAALAVPPAREIPGIRMMLQPTFDVSPETGPGEDGGVITGDAAEADAVAMGTVLDASRVPSWPLSVPRASLNRHTFVCGATGAGKSQTVRHLLESATAAGIPWLVIEPAKAEYRLMAARLPGAQVITIRPGDLSAVPAGINPLEPATGPDGQRFPLQAHADLVRALFLAAFQADEPFPQVLAAALTRCYSEAGWDMVTGEPAVPGTGYPALGDLQAAALKVVEDIGYSQEITDNVRGFVSVRIGSLMGGTTGRFLNGGFLLDYARLLDGNVVLEIEDCGDDTDKAFLTGAVLIRLTEYLRMRARAEGPRSRGLRHLTVVEEAHRLLRQPPPGAGGPAAHAVEMFAGLLAEIRAYGEGLVIAEQIPSKLIADVIKNTAVKIVHRLPAKDDRDAVGATMNLTGDQSRYLVTLKPGEAAVFTDGMDYPVLARMPDGTGREESVPAVPGTAAALVTSRSTACPSGCGSSPCTLGRIAAARRALAANRAAALWAELTVAAHLAGWPSPAPPDNVPARLAAADSRLRDCAVACAVDDAVTTRIPAFSARVAAPALAAHVADVMRGILDHGQDPCDGSEQQWLAPARAEAGNSTGTEEPWGESALRDTPPLRDAVLGTRSPSVIEKAAKTWAHAPDFAGHLSGALAGFPDGDTYATGIADAASGNTP